MLSSCALAAFTGDERVGTEGSVFIAEGICKKLELNNAFDVPSGIALIRFILAFIFIPACTSIGLYSFDFSMYNAATPATCGEADGDAILN